MIIFTVTAACTSALVVIAFVLFLLNDLLPDYALRLKVDDYLHSIAVISAAILFISGVLAALVSFIRSVL